MSEEYLSSARLYRPNMFNDQYIGNKNMKRSILQTLSGGHLPQVILFSGSAGTGKTTAARILAKHYRCEERKENGEACDECMSCQNFNEYIKTGQDGLLEDFKEIDSTKSGNKDDIEELLTEALYPTRENYRIYIFDESHAISQVGQNALLKFLEEPPEHMLIILCTTAREKMIDTIISRCTAKYIVVKPKLEEMIELLQRIAEDKGYEYDLKALRLIATRSDLAQRASINKLDELASQYKGHVTYDNVVEAMELIADKFLITFFEILLADYIRIDKYIEHIGIIKESVGIQSFIQELIPFTIRGMYVINGIQVAGLDEAEKKVYKRLFSNLNVMEVGGLLRRITELSNKKETDAEILLLQLGFIGLRNERAMNTRNNIETAEKETMLLDADLLSKADEKELEQKNYDNLLEPTTDTIQEFKEEKMKEIDKPDVLASLFGTTLVSRE